MKLPTMCVAGLWTCDVILGDFSHTLFMLHAMFSIRIYNFIGISTSHLSLVKLGHVSLCCSTAREVNKLVQLDKIKHFS